MNLYNVVGKLYNLAHKVEFELLLSSKKKILAHNSVLYNRHLGERCFVLGNGPSLLNDDIRLLKEEVVFSVNQAYRNESIRDIKPRYHFWIDNNFFEINTNNQEDVELMECIRNTASNLDSVSCFYPIDQYDFIIKNGLFIKNKTFFIYPVLNFVDSRRFMLNVTRPTYSYGTVVQNAINVAIYMGFKEIYLLGCDNTGIINTINSALKLENNDYGYIVSDNEKKRMEKMVEKSNLVDYAYSYYMTLKGYDFLEKACTNIGVKLINCSSTTVLDMIPQMKLEEVINK